jgi:hypothetical protein
MCLQKVKLGALGDNVSMCTAQSGAKKAHDWAVKQLADLFHTTTMVKTTQVARCRGQWFGDMELAAYVADAAGPVKLVMDLCLPHERFGSSSSPSLNIHLHCPAAAGIDKPRNEAAADKIRDYRADYNNCPNRPSDSISFLPVVCNYRV